jgi:hypothetical protein
MTTRQERLAAAVKASDAIDFVDPDNPTVEESDAEMALLTEALGSGFVGAGTASLTDAEKAALLDSPLYREGAVALD